MAGYRIKRINEAIKTNIAKLILHEAEDPRLSATMLTITRVDTSRDLRYAKVYFSLLDDARKDEALAGLKKASHFFVARLRELIPIRYIPHLRFFYDDSIAQMNHVMEKLREIKEADAARGGEEQTEEPADE